MIDIFAVNINKNAIKADIYMYIYITELAKEKQRLQEEYKRADPLHLGMYMQFV
jgi:hypothetical protein